MKEAVKRVVVPARDWQGLESAVDQHFGRCPYFVFVDLNDGEITGVEVMENPYHEKHVPEKVPEFVLGHRVQVVLAGDVGTWAISMFEAGGAEVITGATGTVRYALSLYLGGALRSRTPCGRENPSDHL